VGEFASALSLVTLILLNAVKEATPALSQAAPKTHVAQTANSRQALSSQKMSAGVTSCHSVSLPVTFETLLPPNRQKPML
jgi:hypothetical protein